MKVSRNSRITTYANNGRVSLRSITDTIRYHIEHKDYYYAQKALNEYRSAIQTIFDECSNTADQFQIDINTIKGDVDG